MTLFELVALVFCAATLGVLASVVRGALSMHRLADVAAWPGDAAPRVSVVVAARNEAETLGPALASLLAMDYPQLEVVAINDRSDDGTGELLRSLAVADRRLRPLDVTELPPGWLGKTHALWLGAREAHGDYLLFTDADVVFAPECLRRAVQRCEDEGLDHLTVTPDVPAHSGLLAMMMASFGFGLLLVYQPWKLRRSRRHSLGLGAFNLVRREAYERCGGHAALRMEVLDDLRLGRLLKRGGCTQEALIGRGMLSVEWYRSPREMANGLQKNLFASLDYRIGRLLLATLLIGFADLWPWAGLLWGPTGARGLYAVALGAKFVVMAGMLRDAGWPRRALAWLPVVPWISLALLWRASLSALVKGGITWRGTFYPLSALRSSSSPETAGRD